MSAHQMVCHLNDAFRMAIGEQKVSPATGALQRTVIKWIALYAPLRWPRGVLGTSPEIDQVRGGATSPVDFATDVARLVQMLGQVTADQRGFAWVPHPLFGPMSDAAWLRWGYLHVDHHLRQFGA
jgi:hypothetical protein